MTGNIGRQVVRRLRLGLVFVRAALVYWLQVFPCLASEVRAWRRRARAIPDETLRAVALTVLETKRGNLEGAAAFAAFVPRRHRSVVVRIQVSLQAIYDYVDTLAEQPNADPIGNSHQLHQALQRALEPSAPHLDYYERQPLRRDAGYLESMIETCRASLVNLPSQSTAREAIARLAGRIIYYQSFHVPVGTVPWDPLKVWATSEIPAGLDLRWWETAAAAGSSLGIFALIALAADPSLTIAETEAIEQAYFPWIGGLHSLLDSLVDFEEDSANGQRNFMAQYESLHEAAARMRMLAQESLRRIDLLPNALPHRLVLAGMVGFYLSAPEAHVLDARLITDYILSIFGAIATATLVLHRLHRTL